jgi:sodium-coupled neutral amino acid transporter 11
MPKFLKLLFVVLAATLVVANGKSALQLADSPVQPISAMKSSELVAAASSDKVLGGTATISSSVFNLAKSIVGAGVLSLPSGVAFFSDSPAALVPAGALTLVMGALAAYSFSLIGRACEQHKTKSFQDTWAKSVDEKTAWLISAGITAKTV